MLSVRSLPKICVALGVSDAGRLKQIALASCDHGNCFLELRLDMLDDPAAGAKVIPRILRRHPDALILATCRRKQNGGEFRGSVARQGAVLADAVKAGAALADVEVETAEASPKLMEAFGGKALTVLSYHNFERTPALKPVLRRLRKIPADIYKIATRTSRPSDNLKLLGLCGGEAPLVLLGMGEVGTTTRLLAPARGSVFTFAAPDAYSSNDKGAKTLKATPTAPGQFTASTVRQLYQVQRRKSDTAIYGVIAKPVAHSMSPAVHNRAFKSKRINAIYLPFLVESGYLRDFFKLVAELPLAGASVTIPHKRTIMRYLDSIDPLARGIGAVNTVYRKRGKLCGTNTDAVGVTAPLAKRVKLNRSRALVVGAGGAARAAIFALKDKGSEVVVAGRNPQRVGRLARACGVAALEFSKLEGDYFDLLVQTTPVGMSPNDEGTLFPGRIPADIVFDMVYNPLETRLLRHAAAEGKATVSGLEMFIEQAAAQFKIWTGADPPRTAMRNAALERLQ